MFNKTAIAVLISAATATSNGFAATSTAVQINTAHQLDNKLLLDRMGKLESQMKDLQAENKSLHAAGTKSDDASGTSLLSYVHSDNEQGGQYLFEKLPSSQMPLNIAKIKDQFGKKSLVFGGYLESDISGWNGSNLTQTTGSPRNPSTGVVDSSYGTGKTIAVTTANLDIMANINEWTQAYMVLTSTSLQTPSLQQGFVTFGNLEKYPLFVSIGKSRVAFGNYGGGGPWIGGLTQNYFRPSQQNNVTVSYFKQNIGGGSNRLGTNLSAISNNGDGGNSSSFMYSAFYHGHITKDLHYNVNGGYIYNIEDSGVGADQITNVTNATVQEPKNGQKTGAVNFEADISYKAFGLGGGWASTTQKRDNSGTGTNNRAGAWFVQTTYTTDVYTKPTVFTLAYNGAYNVQNMVITLPGAENDNGGDGVKVRGVNRQLVLAAQSEITTNVLVGLEYGWMGLYNGQHSNEVTLDTSVYF